MATVRSVAMTERGSTQGTATEPSVFTRILRGEIPSEIVLQTEDVFVLRDIAPQAPVHLLVIPKTDAYPDVVALADGDPKLLAHMVEVARIAAVQAGAPDFRLVFNTGPGAGQTVFHVHAHVLGVARDHEHRLGGAGGLDEGTMASDLQHAPETERNR
jgi:histidine triad (HIT) family protein